MKVLLSVVVPVFNAQEYLYKCIHSILLQTFTDFELLLVNDGSIDNSDRICKEFANNDKRVRYFYQNNAGPSVARNKGIEESRGSYLLFVDADDYIEPEMFNYMVHTAIKENIDFMICGLILDRFIERKIISSEVKYLQKRHIINNKNIADNIIDLFENEAINGPCGKLYRTELIKANNLKMNELIHLQEDLLFNVEYIAQIQSLYVSEKCFYHYEVKNENSLTRKYTPNKFDMLNQVHDQIVSYYMNYSIKKKETLQKIYYLFVKNVYSCFLDLFHEKCMLNKREKLSFIQQIIQSRQFKVKIKRADKDGAKYKLLLLCLKLRNKFILYYFSKFLYFSRRNMKLKF